jgi:hypothetical protein
VSQKNLELTKAEEWLRQLVDEWAMGIAMKTSEVKVVAGCGEMSAKEEHMGINCEINGHIEGYEDFYQNDFWTVDSADDTIHLLRSSSDGQIHDHRGQWIDDATLELYWRGTFEDQEQEEQITAKWVNRNQFEIKENNYSKGKLLLTTDYVFKRKQLGE